MKINFQDKPCEVVDIKYCKDTKIYYIIAKSQNEEILLLKVSNDFMKVLEVYQKEDNNLVSKI